MNVLIVSLSNLDYKEDVLLALQSAGIQKASVWDAKNLNQSLESEFSLFSGFFSGGSTHENEKLIMMSVIESKEEAKEFISNLEAGGVPIDTQDILTVFVVPTSLVFNSELGLIEN